MCFSGISYGAKAGHGQRCTIPAIIVNITNSETEKMPEKGGGMATGHRRAEFDVTNRVNTTDPVSVSFHVAQIYESLYPHEFPSGVLRVFADVGRLYRGDFPGYHPCETGYHDIQHVLEVTLAMARLMEGCARTTGPAVIKESLFLTGIVSALFHDIGCLRRLDDTDKQHGAEYISIRVGRGVDFMRWYLPFVGLGDLMDAATGIVHFTGYEIPVSQIPVDPQYRMLGNLLGSADILAQMADRCYLEKCRDRLYPELVLGGIAREKHLQSDGQQGKAQQRGKEQPLFATPEELIFKTPDFFKNAHRRLVQDLGGVFRYIDGHSDGRDFYYTEVCKNIEYALTVADAGDLSLLRRSPPGQMYQS